MSPAIRASENALFNADSSRLMLLLAAPSSCRFATYSRTSDVRISIALKPLKKSSRCFRSEEPNTACQRKPTAPLALSSSERLHNEPVRAHFDLSLRPHRPEQQWVFHQAEKGIDNSAGPAIWLRS